MRTIREMLGNEEKVLVCLESRKIWDKFVKMVLTESFHFGELPSEKWNFGYVIVVHNNSDMGYFPLYIWCMYFSTEIKKKL